MTEPDLGTLHVATVIIHDVPRKSVQTAEAAVRCSDLASEVTHDLRVLLRLKITDGASPKGSFAVFFRAGDPAPVPNSVKAILAGGADFVGESKRIAYHLYRSQPKVSPAGLATIIECTVDGRPALAILKLEREEGIVLDETEENGLRTFDLGYLTNLIVTQKTRLQKLGLFAAQDGAPGGYWGRVCDRQRGYDPNVEVADFFLHAFLGCELIAGAAPVATSRFFDATERFINEVVTDPETKARYQLAALAEMQATRTVINPSEFADAHIALPDRQKYMEALAEAEVPQGLFDKDVETVKTRIKRMMVAFDNGVVLTAPHNTFSDVVRLKALDDGRAEASTQGHIKKVGGA